jgi:hypothetical protein
MESHTAYYDPEAISRPSQLINVATQLRKAKKEQIIQSMRKIKQDNIPSNFQLNKMPAVSKFIAQGLPIQEILLFIKADLCSLTIDYGTIYEYIQYVRLYTLDAKSFSPEVLLSTGIVPKIVQHMTSIDNIAYEALWCLINISGYQSKEPKMRLIPTLIDCSVIPKALSLLSNHNSSLVEEALWLLSNIAGEGQRYVKMILEADIHNYVTKILYQDAKPLDHSLIDTCMDLISNLIRFELPYKVYVEGYYEFLVVVLKESQLSKFHKKALLIVHSLTAAENVDYLKGFITNDLIISLINFIEKTEQGNTTISLKILNNITQLQIEKSGPFYNMDITPLLEKLIERPSSLEEKVDAICIIANFAGESCELVEKLLNSTVLHKVLELLMTSSEPSLIEEGIYIFINLFMVADESQFKKVTAAVFLQCFTKLLQSLTVNILHGSIKCMNLYLVRCKGYKMIEELKLFEALGIDALMHALNQKKNNDKVARGIDQFLKNYNLPNESNMMCLD